jgi:ribosomal-protein-alanine N-acetyltransferase
LTEKELRLKHITAADMDDLLALEHLCFSRPWTATSFLAELLAETACHLGIEKNTDPAGENFFLTAYLFFRVIADEMQIMKIAVGPAHRGQGIASLLLGAGIQQARQAGAAASFLEVRSSNTAALAFYTGQGFRQIGIRKDYYPGNKSAEKEDALLLMKNLKEGL